jgi:endonuclease/exonuclease/phosphatase family metal-dependent hydrolase
VASIGRLFLVLLAVAACGAGSAPAADAGGSPAITLRVMTQNIFHGGDELNLHTRDFCHRETGCTATLEQIALAIRRSGADAVGLQEPEMNTQTIADMLGWYANPRTSIISRYPLIDPSGGDGVYVYAELAPGRYVALANTHTPSDPYGPYLVRDGGTLQEVLELERTARLPFVADQVRDLPPLARAGLPVFLTGDFNSPSSLDWTAAVAAVRSEVRYPVRWPVSEALAHAGFKDSYREIHPDPVAVPGFTWTPGGPESDPHEVFDRIDWVLHMGPVTPTASRIVGEPGGPDVDVAVGPWPSDHRGVVSTFRTRPAAPPAFVGVTRRLLAVGEPLRVWFGTRQAARSVAIVHAGAPPSAALLSHPTAGALRGSPVFATGSLSPGVYDAVLVDAAGHAAARMRVWLHAPGAKPWIGTAKHAYAPGEPIVVRWRNDPGMHWDWVGLFRAGAGDAHPHAPNCATGYCGNGGYLAYEYTRTAPAGSITFDAGSGGPWPLKPGAYEMRLLLDDGYRAIARSVDFTVQ